MNLLQELEQLEENKQNLIERWGKTGLLKKINNEEVRGGTAVLLENERLINESQSDKGDNTAWKRCSIPLVRRVVPRLAIWELASVQPLLATKGSFFYFEGNKLHRDSIEAKEYRTKCNWSPEAVQDLRSTFNLDAEAELVAVLAQELALELDRRLITDIRNGAGIIQSVDFHELSGSTNCAKGSTLQQVVINLAEEVRVNCRRGMPTWILTSPEMSSVLVDKPALEDDYTGSLGIQKAGFLEDFDSQIAVWTDPLSAPGSVVMGYKGEHEYDSGYVFCPYLIAKRQPVVLDSNSFAPRRSLSTIYGTRLTDPKCYATLKIANFVL